MANKKKYWTGPEEINQTEEFLNNQKNEFPADMSVDEFLGDSKLPLTSTNRRDFLKFLGFSVTAATIAACETPVVKSIPYVTKPEEITPGIPNYYATTYYDGLDYANILVKTREGRPIYIKGNKKHGISRGAVNPRVNSSVLSLYDSARLAKPMIESNKVEWPTFDSAVSNELRSIANSGGNITLLTGTIISPSIEEAISEFTTSFAGATVKRVTYDPISNYGIRKANEMSFGRNFIPSYDFSKAKTIVSISADFLNNWLLHNEYVAQYGQRRNPKADWMSRHFQFEANLSLTGSNADVRIPIKPSEEGAVAAALYNEIAKKTGGTAVNVNSSALDMAPIQQAAKELLISRGGSLVVAGSNNPDVQVIVNGINQLLGNYGSTISTDIEVFVRQGNDEQVMQLVNDMNAGAVNALLVFGVNPAYSLPNANEFVAGLSKVSTTVAFSQFADETASKCKYVAAESHYLESWNDFHPKTGSYSIAQPAITRLYDTRQFPESLLRFTKNYKPYLDFIKDNWRKNQVSPNTDSFLFDDFWYNTVRNGSMNVNVPESGVASSFAGNVSSAAARLVSTAASEGNFEIALYANVAIGDGSHASNPWLQELPDPITRVVWDNYITMNPADAKDLGFNINLGQEEPASVAIVNVNSQNIKLPVYPAPGQKRGTIGIALGYGRGSEGEKIGRAAYRTKQYGGYEVDDDGRFIPVGKNVYPLVGFRNGTMQYEVNSASIEASGETFPIACTQYQNTVMDRTSVVRETTFSTFKSARREKYNPSHLLTVHEGGDIVKKDVDFIDIWKDFPVTGVGHRWGMSVDLSACIGCGSCVIGCNSENNIPVVGKDEVRRGRDMHWMRIDRYFSSETTKKSGEEDDLGTIDMYAKMEIPAYENPETVFMPMMCQHCNHAPCETVCPVAATTHSNEGLNQMTYNRCIGTRYCANNCPYKVRRFNWFNYKAYDKFAEINPAQDKIERMVLNPDVTVRSRGVMEKCTFCVQRIQYGKLEAKKAGEPVADGLVQTACAEACPTNAIIFGDLNDSNSEVRSLFEDDRRYFALQEVGTKPNVGYQLKVRNVFEG